MLPTGSAVTSSLAVAEQELLGETPGLEDKTPKVSCDSPFFYVETSVLSAASQERWTRDALVTYLLHCRGYSAKARCSLMGEKAVRVRLGLTKAPWERAQQALEQGGWLRSISGSGSRRPRTCIAAGSAKYTGPILAGMPAKDMDGHRYEDVADLALLKAPWTLIDGPADGAGPSLADLQGIDAILLLLSIYGFARADGVIPLREAWLAEREGEFSIHFGSAAREDFPGDQSGLEQAAEELLDSGLLYAGVEGHGGRWVLHLFHPMAPTGLAVAA